MPLIIRTEYVNVNGTAKVRAKSNGKQKTTAWNHAKSTAWNHGTAAGALVLAHANSLPPVRLDTEVWEHDSNDSGTKHGFCI